MSNVFLTIAAQKLQTRTVCFAWVPAHSGIEGNESVDFLAKLGSDLSVISDSPKQPLSVTVSQIERNARLDWHLEAVEQVSEWSRPFVVLDKSSKPIGRYSTQFLTGHGLFNSYTHFLEMATTSVCCLSSQQDDSPYHALFDCSNLNDSRAATLGTIGLRDILDLPLLLNEETQLAFFCFCKVHHLAKKRLIFTH